MGISDWVEKTHCPWILGLTSGQDPLDTWAVARKPRPHEDGKSLWLVGERELIPLVLPPKYQRWSSVRANHHHWVLSSLQARPGGWNDGHVAAWSAEGEAGWEGKTREEFNLCLGFQSLGKACGWCWREQRPGTTSGGCRCRGEGVVGMAASAVNWQRVFIPK